MPETYGEVFSNMIDRAARYEDRADIFRKLEISRNQFYNVTNPNRQTSGGNPYPFPTEWGVRATKELKDYEWAKTVCRDMNCICITPEDIEELEGSDPAQALAVVQKILGMVKNR